MSERRRGTNQGSESGKVPAERADPFGDSAAGERVAGEGEAPDYFDEDGSPVFVVPIEEVLDLHSFLPRDILGVVDAYLDAALERGYREVRLIHGRGKGVQRANVQRSLSRDERVERYSDAPHHRGGWGATVVWLRAPEVADDPGSARVPDTAREPAPEDG